MGVPKVDPSRVPSYDSGAGSGDGQLATVQVGETSISQVAQRLGLSPESLLQANPQIKDPERLQAGQDIRLPQAGPGASSDTKPSGSASTLLGSPSTPPDHGTGDPMARTMFQMRLADSGHPVHDTKAAEVAHDKRLTELAHDPGEAHQAWKNLSTGDRATVLGRMTTKYGSAFAQKFLEVATKGKPDLGTQNYQPGTGPTSEEMLANGYRLERSVLGNAAVEVQVWVHPSGKTIMKDVSTWKPGETPAPPPPPTGGTEGTGKTGGTVTVDPKTVTEQNQNKALDLRDRLQDTVQNIRDLMEKKPVPWDQVVTQFHKAQDLNDQLKNLGATVDAATGDPAKLDMSGVDDEFGQDLDQANQDLLDLRTEAGNGNPDFESDMQKPYVLEPEDAGIQ